MLLTSSQIKFILDNREKIPNDFWRKTEGGKYDVIWIVNRQKPSVEPDYSFDEERLGITKDGKIIFGFDSGCSCPSPWHDCGDDVYEEKTWKEFEIDPGNASNIEWNEECVQQVKDLILLVKEDVQPEQVFTSRNAEIRRLLMKKVGFDNIRKSPKFKSIMKEGSSELFIMTELNEEELKFPITRCDGWNNHPNDKEKDKKIRDTEVYVKVLDADGKREYALFLGGLRLENLTGPNIGQSFQGYIIPFRSCKHAIASTFDLEEHEYNPIIET